MGNSTSIKSLVLFHDACSDGFAAAFAAWLKLGDDAEYVPCQYGKESEHFYLLEDGSFDSDFTILNREIFILDFSFPKWVMDGLFDLAERVTWRDHHKTAFETFDKNPEFVWQELNCRADILLDNNKSGAYLAWEYFHPDTEVPLFIRHIDDYDRWQFKIDGTKAFNKAIWSHAPWSFKQWVEWFYDRGAGFTHKYWADFYTEGAAILRAHDGAVQSVVKNAARNCEIPFDEEGALDCVEPRLEWNNGGYWMVHGLAANCPPHLQSDVGHELATQSGTFGLLWCIDKDNQCKCSLRSNGDYDVSAIAKAFGGGGHRNAAGFTTDIQTLLEWIK